MGYRIMCLDLCTSVNPRFVLDPFSFAHVASLTPPSADLTHVQRLSSG